MKSVAQDGRTARWEAHRQRRRHELLRAVRHSVAQLGADASMDQISLATGTSKTVFYRYFQDRAGLETEMGKWAMRTIVKQLDKAGTHATTPREALEAMITAFIQLAASRPHVYRFCDRGVTQESGQHNFFEATAGLLCTRMQLAGHTEYMWARGAIGFVRACTDEWLATMPEDPERFAKRLSTWLWMSAPVEKGTA